MVSKCTCTKVREDKAGVWQGKAQLTAKFLDQGSIKKKKTTTTTYSLRMPNPYCWSKNFITKSSTFSESDGQFPYQVTQFYLHLQGVDQL